MRYKATNKQGFTKLANLTKKEQAWMNKLQKVIDECPSKRIGFYTIGDSDLVAFDATKMDKITNHLDSRRCGDFGPSVSAVGAGFDESLVFNNPVESTAG